MESSLPTADDISPTKGLQLDERTALKNFLGKNLDQAEELLTENPLRYLEDFMWMGPNAFKFYYESLSRYLQVHFTPEQAADSDVLHALIGLLKFRFKYDRISITPIAGAILNDLEFCIGRYEEFEVNESICGDLLTELRELREKIAAPPLRE